MAEMAVGHNDTHIRTGSIGSCVVIVLYDGVAKIGGMAHAMLSTRMQNKETGEPSPKYANEAVDLLLKKIETIGGMKERLKAKLIGGAHMFQVFGEEFGGIGNKNVEAAKKRLRELDIPVESADVGGTVGKVAELDLETGLVEVITKI